LAQCRQGTVGEGPLGRHEILNELNKQEIYDDIAQWLERKI
jgi:alpha-beta hydrolase superfamily lysophospholipase